MCIFPGKNSHLINSERKDFRASLSFVHFSEKLPTISVFMILIKSSGEAKIICISLHCRFIQMLIDGSYKSSNHQEASIVLDDILRNLPHKPMKSVGYEGYSGFQLPIPDDLPPPFRPINTYSSYNTPFETQKSINSEYGPPSNHFSDYHGQSSNKKVVAVNPKAYDIYHTMKLKLTKEKNFVTAPPTNIDNTKGLEILKSIEYEIKA